MKNIRIITDSASDLVNVKREDMTVLPLTISFGQEEYQDGVTLTHRQFYEKLIESDTLPVTSQIPPYAFEEAIREAVKKGDEIIIITLSGKLSGTYQSAVLAAKDYEDSVYVVDSENVAVGEKILVEYALRLKDYGYTIKDIVRELNRSKKQIHLVALLDTLEYLKKGGRISAAAAVAGGILSIKPVVEVKDGVVGILGKARGSRQGNNLIAEQLRLVGVDFTRPYALGYTGLSDATIRKYVEDNAALWKSHTDSLPIDTVGGTIGTHVGPGAIAVAWFAPDDRADSATAGNMLKE